MENKIVLSSGTLYSYGLNRFFGLAAKAGYDGIELIIDEKWDSRDPEYVKSLEKQFGIKVLSVHSAMEFATFTKDAKSRLFESIEIAKKINVRLIVVHTWDYTDTDFANWLYKNRKSICQKAAPIDVAFENGTKSYNPDDPEKFMSEAFKAEYFGKFENIVLDTSHLATAKSDIVKMVELLGPKIKHLHFSDSDFVVREDRPNSIQDRHLIPGRGKLPLKKYLHALKKINYSGIITIELLPESVEAGLDEKVVLNNLKEALDFVKNNFK